MQAIIITAYKDPQMLYRLCDKFDKDRFRLFIHIDKRYISDFDVKRIKANSNAEVYSKYAITWGSIKHLYAILALMKKALRFDDVKYLHIISGQDYPVCDLSEAEEDKHIYLDFAKVLPERFRQYNPCQKLDQKNTIVEHLYRGSIKIQKLFSVERKTIGDYNNIYKGTIWSSMPRNAALYALKIVENEKVFMRDLYYTYIPEEIFFQTIFMNSIEWTDKIVRNNKRYDDWNPRDNSSTVPVTLDERDFDAIKRTTNWFARKMDSSRSVRLIKKIDGIGISEKNELISIVITTCNRKEDILLRAVKSAKDQTYKNTEIIVINDAPQNGESVRNALRSYPDVRYVENYGEHGVSNVRNLAVKEAEGEYIAFLDDDDEWLPDKLKLQAEEFDNETGLVYCSYYAIRNGKVLKSDENRTYPQGEIFQKLLGENFIGGCSVPLLSKKVLTNVGEFDTNISYGEDYDMWLRIAKKYKVACVFKDLVKYNIGSVSLSSSFSRRMKGWEYLLEKYRDDYVRNPDSYRKYIGINVCEVAKRTDFLYSFKFWKKYGNTKEYLKGLTMKVMGIY